MAKYDITKEATEDLFRIWEYTMETWSEEQADTYYSILELAMTTRVTFFSHRRT